MDHEPAVVTILSPTIIRGFIAFSYTTGEQLNLSTQHTKKLNLDLMTNPQGHRKNLAAFAGAATLLAGAAFAGDAGKVVIDDKGVVEPEAWSICNVFDHNTLFEADQGFIRSVSAHGRYQGQYISQDEDIDGVENDFDAWQHRRARLGLKIEMDHGLKFYAEANFASFLGSQDGPFFDSFQDFYLDQETDTFWWRVGKQKQNFTIEDKTSSKKIKTIERSAIVNETAGARPWGAVVGFEAFGIDHAFGGWLYGGHSDAPEFIDFDANGGLSYNATYALLENTDLHFDYVHADNNGGSEGTEGSAAVGVGPEYEHSFSLGTSSNFGKLNVIVNGIIASNRSGGGGIPDGNDTWGFYVLPSYALTDKLDIVFRYAYMDEGREQRTQRYDVRAAVEDYHTFYGGLQYKLCGDHLKVMAGYEYATGDIFKSSEDIETGSWQLAVRTYF